MKVVAFHTLTITERFHKYILVMSFSALSYTDLGVIPCRVI